MIRQFPISLGGSGSDLSPYASLDPSNFTLDLTDIGSDFGSGFSGLVSSIDFLPTTQGTAWAHFNFKSSGFDNTKDIFFDLHWIANGSIGTTLATRITVKAWVVDTEGVPILGFPTDTQTTNISILDTKTGMKMMTANFSTIETVNIPATCESILISITREADHVDDTYTGTFQLVDLIARQVI